jgi:DNA-binding LacI/PurR family transcriptional regulator
VSKAAASFALNGRAGVSGETRARVVKAANELGWQPHTAARALSMGGSSSIGLVLARPVSLLSSEPFYMEFIAGLESVLVEGSMAVTLKIVPDIEREMQVYEKWSAGRVVGGVVVTDLRQDDPRPALLRRLGLSAVVVSGEAELDGTYGLAHVRAGHADGMRAALEHLRGLGHTRFARLSGSDDLLHCASRTTIFRKVLDSWGLEAGPVLVGDFTAESGATLMRGLLESGSPRPTAILADNDLMAVGALQALHDGGLSVPGDVSVFAWNNSALCLATRPTLSSLANQTADIGARAATALLDVMAGRRPTLPAAMAQTVVERQSTGPAPA